MTTTAWEYKTIRFHPQSGVDDLEQELNAIGRDGWEMCGGFLPYYVILKRPA